MKKTKIVAALAAMALAFTLFSCANSSDSDGGNSSTPDNGGEENKLPEGVIEFGMWPQSKIKDGVNVDPSTVSDLGLFTGYKGSDDAWYVQAGEDYFKVEPIQWKCITDDYMNSGKKLYVSVNILDRQAFYDCNIYNYEGDDIDFRDYKNSSIRAWLNGISYTYVGVSEEANELLGKRFVDCGFFQKAFTESEQKDIAEIEVKSGCVDKVFLLSTADYNNEDFFENNKAREAERTEYAKALDTSICYWTSTPSQENSVYCITGEGGYTTNADIGNTDYAVRPAFCMK